MKKKETQAGGGNGLTTNLDSVDSAMSFVL